MFAWWCQTALILVISIFPIKGKTYKSQFQINIYKFNSIVDQNIFLGIINVITRLFSIAL